MRIGIVGAGAIGGWLGIPLAVRGHDVNVLARNATLEALRQGPWQMLVDGSRLEAAVNASDDASTLGEQDVLIIAVKGPSLAGVVPTIGPMIGVNTMVIPAMNGVPWWFLLPGGGELPPTHLTTIDPDGAIAAAIPLDRVLGCVVHTSAWTIAPGKVRYGRGGRLILGEPLGRPTTRLRDVANELSAAGADVEVTERIRHAVWYKLLGNMTMNPISALTGATCDRILDDPLLNAYVLEMMAEATEIGRRIGVVITEGGEDRNAVTRLLGAFKTSMLRDVEAGRSIELDDLLAAPFEIAQKLGMATPHLASLFGLTRLFGRQRGLYPE